MTATTSSSLTLQNTKAAAQILAITTSALFAGYTASMSLITVPMMLECFGRSETSKVIVRSDATTSTTTKIDDSGISSRHVGHDKDHVSAPMKLGSVSNNRKFSPPNETLLLSQWRQMYVHGATTARPATAVPVICYLFLLYTCFAESRSGDVRDKDAREQGRQLGSVVLLYTVALMGQCGIVLALTVLRRTNGALGIRCAVSWLLALSSPFYDCHACSRGTVCFVLVLEVGFRVRSVPHLELLCMAVHVRWRLSTCSKVLINNHTSEIETFSTQTYVSTNIHSSPSTNIYSSHRKSYHHHHQNYRTYHYATPATRPEASNERATSLGLLRGWLGGGSGIMMLGVCS